MSDSERDSVEPVEADPTDVVVEAEATDDASVAGESPIAELPAAEPIEPTEADIALARSGLLEITEASTIGAVIGGVREGDGSISVFFAAEMAGYPGWHWTASLAHVEGAEPTVLEVELMPGDGALLSPDWVPWVDRLADYRAGQDAEAAEASGDGPDDDDDDSDDDSDDDDSDDDDDDSDDDDDDDDDDDESDDDATPVLHGGDLDGVDIDDLDESVSDDDDSDDDDDSGGDEADNDDEADDDDSGDADDDDSDESASASPSDGDEQPEGSEHDAGDTRA